MFTLQSTGLRVFAVFVAGLCLPGVARPGQLLQDAVMNHQAAIDSIRALRCRVSVLQTPAPPWGADVTDYWRNGSNFRCRSRSGSVTTDCSFRDGVTRLYTSTPGQKGDLGRVGQITTKDMAYTCDAWSYGLMSFYGNDRFRVGLKELVSSEGATASARLETRDGRRLVRLDISHGRADLKIWLDPEVNYLARHVRTVTKRPHGNSDGEATVETFQEFAAGIFLPTKIRCETVAGPEKKRKRGWVADFSSAKVNEPIPARDLDVRFPPGVLVGDEIRNGMFRTNAEGAPVLPALNAEGKKYQLASGPPVPTPEPGAPPSRVSEEEPQPRSRWILPAAGGFLALALVFSLVKRLRTRRQGINSRADARE